MLATAIALLLGSSLQAEACDIRKLKKQLAESSPRAMPEAYIELASCDAGAAREAAPDAFQKILGGPEGAGAAIAAVEAGAGAAVRDWISNLISDERAQTLSALGDQCADHEVLPGFFVEARDVLGDRFYRDRWHRALTDCRHPSVHDLLRRSLQEDDVQRDASRFGSILEVFCRQSGREAIPWLKALMVTTEREENQLHIMSAFADAAGVGSLKGPDPEAAEEAVAAILDVAPQVPPKVVEQGRITLQSLGASAEASSLAGVRYADVRQPDGTIMWGLVVVETATCRKGDIRLGFHYSPIYDAGHRWSDQMGPAAEAAVQEHWTFDLGRKCRGESTTQVLVSPEPFADTGAMDEWRDQHLREVRTRSFERLVESQRTPPVLP